MVQDLLLKIEKMITAEDKTNRKDLFESITEESVIKGMAEAFRAMEIDNVLEYFRGFRDLNTILCGRPYSSLLTREEYKAYLDEKKAGAEKEKKLPISFCYKKEYKILGHFCKVLCFVFDRDESAFFTGGKDGLVKMWDTYTGRLLKSFYGHKHPIFDFVVGYNNDILVSCDETGVLIFWNMSTAEILANVDVKEQIEHIECIYPGKEPVPLEQKSRKKKSKMCFRIRVLVITGSGQTLRVSLTKDGKNHIETLINKLKESAVNAVAFSRGKKLAVFGGMWPLAFLLDVESEEAKVYILETEDFLISDICVSPSSIKFAASTYSSTLFIWKYDLRLPPSKSNIPARRTFKGRDLEGAWVRESIKIEEMESSVYIKNIIFLSDDVTLVSVDNDSNIRIVDTERKSTIMIEKDFKVCSIVSHPRYPFFLSLETNGVIKVISKSGEIMSTINTEIFVAGGLFLDSTGTFFFLTDLNGGINKFSLWQHLQSIPESEFYMKDFTWFKEVQSEEDDQRVREDILSRMEKVLEACKRDAADNKHRDSEDRTYTLQGNPIDLYKRPQSFPIQTYAIEEAVRSAEIAALILLQPNMMHCKILEQEYGPILAGEETINIPDTNNSSNSTIEVLSESESTEEAYSTPSCESEDSGEISFGSATYSEAESSIEGSTSSSRSSESQKEDEEISDTESNQISDSSEEPTHRRRRVPQRMATKRIRYEVAPEIEFSEWIMMKDAAFPIIPQVKEKLLFIPSRTLTPREISRNSLNATEIVVVKDAVIGFSSLSLTLQMLRTKKTITIEYMPSNRRNDPFIPHKYYLDSTNAVYSRGQSIYFYEQGMLSKGSFIAYKKNGKRKILSVRKESIRDIKDKETETEIEVFDVKCAYKEYSIENAADIVEIVKEYRKEEYIPFFLSVSKKKYPDYYSIVPYPISLDIVLRRLALSFYRTKEALIADIKQIHTNCLLYNEESSEIVSLCKELIESILEEIL